MAQDLGRSSLDGENPPATEVDVEFPSPFHRTNWVRQHRQKCWEGVKHRRCLMWAGPRGEAWVVAGGPRGVDCQDVSGSVLRENCDIESVMLGVPTQATSPWEGRKKGRKGGRQVGRREERKAGRKDKARFTV